MRRIAFGVLLTALATLVLELMLLRAFEVTLAPNIAYFIVTLAVFSFGLAGVYATLRPIRVEREIRPILAALSVGFAAATLLLIPIINALPLDWNGFLQHPATTLAAFGALYVVLLAPFFLAGYLLITVFSKYADSIQRVDEATLTLSTPTKEALDKLR